MSELTATNPEIPLIVAADITLNPNQPTQSIQLPSARKGTLLIGMGRLLPCESQRPNLGPRIYTPARAIQPPIECTTTEPA